MELRHLRYFVGVAEELHFGRAAERLGISQPPLSQQIKALEDELGVPLFARTSRRVKLTEAGQFFLAEAYKTLAQADHAMAVARRAQDGELGELTIGFASSVPFTAIVAKALSTFREAYPAVRLNLSEMTRDEQVAALVDERMDIGFIRGFDPPMGLPSSLIVGRLSEEPLLVAMPADHPLARAPRLPLIEDLRDQPFVLYQRDFGVGFNEHLSQLCAKAGFLPHVVQEAKGVSTLLGLVAAGMGLTVITSTLGALHPENVVFRLLDHPEALSGLWLIHQRRLSKASQHFVDLVTKLS